MTNLKKLCVISFTMIVLATAIATVNGQKVKKPATTTGVRSTVATGYNIRTFGAIGDGKTPDTPAINRAIDAAAAGGGGTVYFPAGKYLSYSIHLKSNITLYLDQGAVIVAGEPTEELKYDAPEPNPWDMYQDYGHSHWHNSLIWGEQVENIAIMGTGLIWGKGLIRNQGPNQASQGAGNKAISLKLCRNVIIRDISILHGGHFAILATGVDNFTIDNLKIDTNRDGIDLDCCRHVRVSNCSVNSPFDDGICPKSSFALGFARATENVTITNCQVSGYDEGTFLDGTYKREYNKYSHNSTTGRIKFGTESNGGFKNITISNCVFDYSRGLALESVDGGLLEDVTIDNITMRDITNSPIFIRLGNRARGPKETTTVGQIRRVNISNFVVYNANSNYGSIISGIPGHPIEDLKLSNIRIYYQGGGTNEQAALDPPEKEKDYPEPVMFGEIPAYGFFIRHVMGLQLSDVEVSYMKDDRRPPFILNDVKGAEFLHVKAQHLADVPTFLLNDVEDFTTRQSSVPDKHIDRTKKEKY